MKKNFLFAAIGVGLVLTACSGQTETLDQASVEQQSGQQAQVTEMQPAAATEQETEARQETEQETETQQETERETMTQQETDAQDIQKETKVQETAVAEEKEVPEKPVQVKGELTQADIAVIVRGVTVVPGDIMENYIGALGEPDALEGSPSCIEEGDDKTYTYGGVLIYTYRANGTDRINLIEITGTESLGKGIHIGDTTDTVIAAYGDAYAMEGNEMLYEINDKVIGLQMTDGKVSFMELFAR